MNSPLGKVFNKGLDESDKKEGLLKRLKNIEGKNEQQLEAIRDEGEKQLDAIGKYDVNRSQRIRFSNEEDKKAVELVGKIDKIIQLNRNKSFVCTHSNRTKYDFNEYRDINQYG